MVEVFIMLFFIALCCLAVFLSVSVSGRRRSLPDRRSAEQSLPGFIEIQYEMLGRRLKRIGNIEIQYDMFDSRPKCLGDIELQYEMLGGRLKRIGNMEIRYDMFDSRPKSLGAMEIQYEIFGGRPKYIVTMNNDANLTQHNLITIFFVLYERTKKIKAARLMRRQM
jgi:hypothetical protein